MICPECSRSMVQLPCRTPINYASEIQWEKHRCDYCRLTAKVEIVFTADEPAPAVKPESP